MSRAYCEMAPGHPVHAAYHATEYGFPVREERALFERLCLEIMQAGLSWEIVLKKRAALNAAFDRFDVDLVVAYGPDHVERLLSDPAIIRNRLKIKAIIHNARVVAGMRATHQGFANWLDAHHKTTNPPTKPEWVKLFRKTFTFTGGEITGEFLMSIGLLPDAHWPGCEIYAFLQKKNV